MKQASLKLKRNIKSVSITNNNREVGAIIFNAMFSTIVLLGLIYSLILGNMVFNIVQRKNLEKQELTLSSQVGDLELSYLSIAGSVNVAMSSSMGFEKANISYATRKFLGYNITSSNLESLKVNNEI